MRPLQVSNMPRFGPQQAPTVSMQSTTIPASTAATQFDLTTIMPMMITMMIVVMMMKMMTGAMATV